MNLIKLFNISYLKENLKKSKGVILLLIILIPLFTTLHTIINVNGTENYTNIPDKEWLASSNIYGMYVIPVILSFILFGYVYKKNSVDLINSMPINRKSIFVTNTVIGIVIITIIQVLTAISLVLCNCFLEYIHIYMGVIIDLFIVMWVAYVFVFTATNLAMTLSGTFTTQLILTVLILFFVPFLIDSYNDFSHYNECNINVENDIISTFVIKENEYLLPYDILRNKLGITEGYEVVIYKVESIRKMLIISAIYATAGVILFQKRKMENCEESFSNDLVHLLVKGITMLPIMILINWYTEENRMILTLCSMSFYYYIYDLIVKRNIKLKTSIISFILTFAILYGTCSGLDYLKNNRELKNINFNEIKEIAITQERYGEDYIKFNILDIFTAKEHFLNNKELIDIIFKSAVKAQKQQNEYDAEYEKYINNEIEDMTSYLDTTKNLNIIIKDEKGNIYETSFNILAVDFDKIINILENDEDYKKRLLAELDYDDKILLDEKILNQDIKNILKNEIRNKINSINKEEMYFRYDLGTIQKYYYENHKLVYTSMYIEMTPEMLRICGNELNKECVEMLNIENQPSSSNIFNINLVNEGMWYGISHKYIELRKTRENIQELILENKEFNPNEAFYTIQVDQGKGQIYTFFTNDVEEIDKLILLEVEQNPNYYWEYEFDSGMPKYYRTERLFQNYYVENM